MDIYEKYKKIEDLPVSTLVVEPDKWNSIKGVMHFVHGMCEHKGRYMHVIEYFKEKGYICVISDLRGHGDNAMYLKDYGYFGENGHEVLVNDIRAVNVFIKNTYPDFPIIMYGHSMGSLIVKNFLKKYDDEVDFVFLSGSPANTLAKYAGLIITEIQSIIFEDTEDANFIYKFINAYSSRQIKSDVPYAWICTDAEVVEAFNEDEKCGFPFKINGYAALSRLVIGAYSKKGYKVKNKSLPIYFIAGKNDTIIRDVKHFKNQKEFFIQLGYRRIGMHVFDNMRHEIHNEENKEEVFKYMLDKLDRHKL